MQFKSSLQHFCWKLLGHRELRCSLLRGLPVRWCPLASVQRGACCVGKSCKSNPKRANLLQMWRRNKRQHTVPLNPCSVKPVQEHVQESVLGSAAPIHFAFKCHRWMRYGARRTLMSKWAELKIFRFPAPLPFLTCKTPRISRTRKNETVQTWPKGENPTMKRSAESRRRRSLCSHFVVTDRSRSSRRLNRWQRRRGRGVELHLHTWPSITKQTGLAPPPPATATATPTFPWQLQPLHHCPRRSRCLQHPCDTCESNASKQVTKVRVRSDLSCGDKHNSMWALSERCAAWKLYYCVTPAEGRTSSANRIPLEGCPISIQGLHKTPKYNERNTKMSIIVKHTCKVVRRK